MKDSFANSFFFFAMSLLGGDKPVPPMQKIPSSLLEDRGARTARRQLQQRQSSAELFRGRTLLNRE